MEVFRSLFKCKNNLGNNKRFRNIESAKMKHTNTTKTVRDKLIEELITFKVSHKHVLCTLGRFDYCLKT